MSFSLSAGTVGTHGFSQFSDQVAAAPSLDSGFNNDWISWIPEYSTPTFIQAVNEDTTKQPYIQVLRDLANPIGSALGVGGTAFLNLSAVSLALDGEPYFINLSNLEIGKSYYQIWQAKLPVLTAPIVSVTAGTRVVTILRGGLVPKTQGFIYRVKSSGSVWKQYIRPFTAQGGAHTIEARARWAKFGQSAISELAIPA